MSNWKELGRHQEEFTEKLGRLLLYLFSIEARPRLRDAYRDKRAFGEYGEQGPTYGHPRSTHKVGLAVDIIVADNTLHEAGHDFWDLLGGSKRISEDMNHYSFEWEGIR